MINEAVGTLKELVWSPTAADAVDSKLLTKSQGCCGSSFPLCS